MCTSKGISNVKTYGSPMIHAERRQAPLRCHRGDVDIKMSAARERAGPGHRSLTIDEVPTCVIHSKSPL
jgi:hypothetical protein